MEIWKDVIGYEGKYMISSSGRVKSFPKQRCTFEKILKPQKLKAGYLSIQLGDGEKIKSFLIHRLVAMSFIENKELKKQVNHINGVKKDNRVENLEWNTQSENQKHSIATGLRTAKGEKNSQCKLTPEIVIEIRNSNERAFVLAEKYNISRPTISDIKKRRSWSHI